MVCLGTTRPQQSTDCFKEVAMLVLSRKLNEKIVIDGGIVITVVKLDRNQVRLGIEAPGHVPVWREEILRDEPARVPNAKPAATSSHGVAAAAGMVS